MRRSNNEKSPVNWGTILIRTAAVLFCLLMLSVHLLSGLFARYVSKGQGVDSARVAKFDVGVTSVANNVEIEYGVSPGDEGAYVVNIANRSEVAVTYDIKVVVDKPADSFDIQVALEGKKLDTKTSNELIFPNAGYLPAGGKTAHDLMFSVLEWGDFTKNHTGYASRTETLNFRVYVDVVQVD